MEVFYKNNNLTYLLGYYFMVINTGDRKTLKRSTDLCDCDHDRGGAGDLICL